MLRLRRALPITLVLATLLAPAPAVAKPSPLPQPGTYEGTDQAGGIVSVAVDAKRRIGSLSVPGPIDCGKGRLARVGTLFTGRPGDGGLSAPVVIRRGAFLRSAKAPHASVRVSGRVAGRTLIRGALRASVGTGCTYESAFTLRRLERVLPGPNGTWSGTDALGNTVFFDAWSSPAASTLTNVHVAGPYDGCGRLPQHRGVHPVVWGGSSVAYDRSRRTGGFALASTLAGPLGLAIDAGRVVAFPSGRPDGTSVETTFEGTATARTATGRWRMVIRDQQGATLCDSGPVDFQASPAR